MTCGGVLLTGGTSSRMGTDKATLVVRGQTLARRAAAVLARVCDPVIEVGPGVAGLPAVREDPPGSGPLAALVAGSEALETNGPVVLLACDMPFVEDPIVRLLAEWPGSGTVLPLVDGLAQYTCARYGPVALAAAARALQSGSTSLRAVVTAECEYLDESTWETIVPANTFVDVDTWDDLDRLGLS